MISTTNAESAMMASVTVTLKYRIAFGDFLHPDKMSATMMVIARTRTPNIRIAAGILRRSRMCTIPLP